jgi:hypothetical protein
VDLLRHFHSRLRIMPVMEIIYLSLKVSAALVVIGFALRAAKPGTTPH